MIWIAPEPAVIKKLEVNNAGQTVVKADCFIEPCFEIRTEFHVLARADLQYKQQSWAPELHLYSEKRTLKKSRKKLDSPTVRSLASTAAFTVLIKEKMERSAEKTSRGFPSWP